MIKAILFIFHSLLYKALVQGFIGYTSTHYSVCHSFKWPEIALRHTHNQEEQKDLAEMRSFFAFLCTLLGHKEKSQGRGGGGSVEEVKETDGWTCREAEEDEAE